MEGFPEDIRAVFRALAEARDGPFYKLWVDLTYAWPRPMPTIGFRTYQVAESPDALVVLAVEGHRPDRCDVCWSLSLRATPEKLFVVSGVEITLEDGNTDEVFTLSGEAGTSAHATDLIQRYATEVCAERSWMTEGKSS